MIYIIILSVFSILQAQDIYGCTQFGACNYNPEAAIDDGSCIYPIGCNDWCPADWGEPAYMDNCGVCDSNPTNDCEMDCEGIWGGNSILDECGNCCDGITFEDCYYYFDECWGCVPYNSLPEPEMDCAGVCFGDAYIDDCGVCCGGYTGVECSYFNGQFDFGGAYDCCGDCFGESFYDDCGMCCGCLCSECYCGMDIDCNGVCFGNAFENECGCVEGSTGLEPDHCYGCMAEPALNYDPMVYIDDGSCTYLGDLNDDDLVDVSDVVLVVELILSGEGVSDYQLMVGDIDGDTEITIIDVVWLVDIILNA